MEKSTSEKKNICFKALGVSNKDANNILLAELVRLENDERIPEMKGTTILVKDETQKRLIETVFLLFKGESDGFSKVLDNPQNLKIEMKNNEEAIKNSDNIIDFREFDYQTEKQKLINRYNASILGNLDIVDILREENKSTRKGIADETKYKEELQDLKRRIKEVETRLVENQLSIFSIFKQRQIVQDQNRLNELREKLSSNKRTYEEESSYKNFVINNRLRRIGNLEIKVGKLEDVKNLFTEKKERALTIMDKDGKKKRIFVEEKSSENPDRVK